MLLILNVCYDLTNCNCHWNIIFYAGMLLSLRALISTDPANRVFVV